MFDLSGSELLFYGGNAVMIFVVVIAVLCTVLFAVTGKRLGQKQEQEYGNPLS